MFTTEATFLVLYLLFGPLLVIVMTVLALTGRQQMRLISRPLKPLPESPPSVTVLIPAKDEGERIRACLSCALAQTYPNLQFIAIDDRSIDQTGAIMDEMAAADPRLEVLHIPHGDLPAGWTGKCHALFHGVRAARGEWLMFVDSDVVLEPDAVAAAVGRAARHEYDLFSLLPRIEAYTFWEELIIPVAGAALNFMFLVPMANKNYLPRHAFANGQFLLIRRSVYEQIGGHQSVMGMFGEDVAMARLVKSKGYKTRIAWGADFVAVRMYSSLAEIFRGWARQFFAPGRGSPWRILAGLGLVLLMGFSWLPAAGWGIYRLVQPGMMAYPWLWLAAVGVHWCLLTWLLATIYSSSGNRGRFAWAHPLALAMLMGIFVRAVRMCFTKRVEWRGTSYSARPASEGAAVTP